MFWIGHSRCCLCVSNASLSLTLVRCSCRCFVWGKQDYELKMAHDMEDVQLRF